MQLSKIFGYAKAVVAAATPVFALVQAAVTDNKIDGQEWLNILVAVVVAGGVLLVPNKGFVKADPDDSIKARFTPSPGSSGPLE